MHSWVNVEKLLREIAYYLGKIAKFGIVKLTAHYERFSSGIAQKHSQRQNIHR